jgi:flagellar biosynthesis protein FliP
LRTATIGRCVRLATVAAGVGTTLAAAVSPAVAQDISINFGQGGGLTERVIQLIAFITVLSLAPSILVMMTSFTRIVVVLSLLRTALGTATAPPNAVIVALALFLTAFVMGPALQSAYETGIRPLINNEISVEQAFQRSSEPLKVFMQRNVREKDLALFSDLSREPRPETPADLSLRILVPAFMISELKRAFEIGFLLFLPFLIIDLVVASVLMSMGMMMLPPVVVSLPFKLIFFVLVDGWSPEASCKATDCSEACDHTPGGDAEKRTDRRRQPCRVARDGPRATEANPALGRRLPASHPIQGFRPCAMPLQTA